MYHYRLTMIKKYSEPIDFSDNPLTNVEVGIKLSQAIYV